MPTNRNTNSIANKSQAAQKITYISFMDFPFRRLAQPVDQGKDDGWRACPMPICICLTVVVVAGIRVYVLPFALSGRFCCRLQSIQIIVCHGLSFPTCKIASLINDSMLIPVADQLRPTRPHSIFSSSINRAISSAFCCSSAAMRLAAPSNTTSTQTKEDKTVLPYLVLARLEKPTNQTSLYPTPNSRQPHPGVPNFFFLFFLFCCLVCLVGWWLCG